MNERGTAFISLIPILLLISVILCLLLEVYRDFTVRDNITINLNRAGNIAVDLAMLDTFRKDRISRIDSDKARLEFLGYLKSEMKVSGSYPNYSYSSANLQYKLNIHQLTITEQPPKITCEATIIMSPIFLSEWLQGIQVEFNVKSITHNVRIEGFR